MIITESGEVGIHYEGQKFKLRPSFAAISSLGTGKDIVEWFSTVCGAPNDLQLHYSVAVLCACSEEDISHLIGIYSLKDGVMEFHGGIMSEPEIILLAQSLMKHGVVGDVEASPKSGNDGDYSSSFDAKKYVSMAIAHLGMGESESWNLTMTSFLGALEAKFPNTDKKDTPTLEEVDQTMEWFESVRRARNND